MTDSALHDSSRASAAINLSELPSKVAQVQAELHHLGQAVQQTRQTVRQAELATQESRDSQQIMQQQLQQDLAKVHMLQLQQADLLALKSAKGKRIGQCGKQAVLQVSIHQALVEFFAALLNKIGLLPQKKQVTARQQLMRITAAFEGICDKFQARFRSEQMEASSAATADAAFKLESQIQITHQDYCQQKQLSQDAAQLLQQGQQRVHTLCAAIDGMRFRGQQLPACIQSILGADTLALVMCR